MPMTWKHKSVEVDVPVEVAYDAFTSPDNFPRFMEGVKEVRAVDARHLHWRAKVDGREKEWIARITHRRRGHRFVWRSSADGTNAGALVFEPDGPGRTRVTLWLEESGSGIAEKTAEPSIAPGSAPHLHPRGPVPSRVLPRHQRARTNDNREQRMGRKPQA